MCAIVCACVWSGYKTDNSSSSSAHICIHLLNRIDSLARQPNIIIIRRIHLVSFIDTRTQQVSKTWRAHHPWFIHQCKRRRAEIYSITCRNERNNHQYHPPSFSFALSSFPLLSRSLEQKPANKKGKKGAALALTITQIVCVFVCAYATWRCVFHRCRCFSSRNHKLFIATEKFHYVDRKSDNTNEKTFVPIARTHTHYSTYTKMMIQKGICFVHMTYCWAFSLVPYRCRWWASTVHFQQ